MRSVLTSAWSSQHPQQKEAGCPSARGLPGTAEGLFLVAHKTQVWEGSCHMLHSSYPVDLPGSLKLQCNVTRSSLLCPAVCLSHCSIPGLLQVGEGTEGRCWAPDPGGGQAEISLHCPRFIEERRLASLPCQDYIIKGEKCLGVALLLRPQPGPAPPPPSPEALFLLGWGGGTADPLAACLPLRQAWPSLPPAFLAGPCCLLFGIY